MRRCPSRVVVIVSHLLLATCLVSLLATQVQAQGCGCGGGTGRRQAVGGVLIDAEGVLLNAEVDQSNQFRQMLLGVLREMPSEVNPPTELRKVSLRRLEAALAEQPDVNRLPQEMRYLAGLQEIRYVIVNREEKDIVLVGFGEGWKVDPRGFVVGKTTGRPVLLLDDLVVALRAARRNVGGGITCSIDPSEQGLKKLQQYVGTLQTAADLNEPKLEETLGPQKISIGGVPASTHFARVLVAADFQMKRIGMAMYNPGVPGLVSYLAMVSGSGRGMQNMTPRWWLTPSFAPLLTDPDGLAWELRGSSVKCLTEETIFAADGSKAQAGKSSPAAQQWADTFTRKYDLLAAKDPIFAQLRSCMELAVVATLIVKHDLPAKAGMSFSVLTDPTQLPAIELDVPKSTLTKVKTLQRGSNVIVSASGGVEIQAAPIVERVERTGSSSPAKITANPPNAQAWWWN